MSFVWNYENEEVQRVLNLLEPSNTAAALVPPGFQAYGRLDHPSVPGSPSGSHGSLRDALKPLLPSLRRSTQTPEECTFCIWEGTGGLLGGKTPLNRTDPAPNIIPTSIQNAERPQGPTGNKYFVWKGPIEASAVLYKDLQKQSPHFWWPDDRAWFIATDIDLPFSLIGCSQELIDRLQAVPECRLSKVNFQDQIGLNGLRLEI